MNLHFCKKMIKYQKIFIFYLILFKMNIPYLNFDKFFSDLHRSKFKINSWKK